MEAHANVLRVHVQAVGRVAFEVVPDLLGGVEFWGVARKPLDVQARVAVADVRNGWPFVDRAVVPDEDHLSRQAAQKGPEEFSHVDGLEGVLLEPRVQAQVRAPC